MTGNRTADTIIALLYMGLLLLFSARPKWLDWIINESARRAKELRGAVSL